MSRARSFVITWNNYTEADIVQLNKLMGTAKWGIYGRETAPTTGTPHLQGYIMWKNARSWDSIRKLLKGADVRVAKGSWMDSLDYGTKELDWVEFGSRPEDPGKREKRRWEDAWDAAKRGDLESIDADIRVRCYGTLKKIQKDYQVVPPDMDKLDFWWFWGRTETGKSRTARAENPKYYLKLLNKWWDGYVDQPCVIIEEMNPEAAKCLGNYLKMWCDHYAFSAETKGGMMTIRPPKIIITSNYSMQDCFAFDIPGIYEPLARRFNVRYFE